MTGLNERQARQVRAGVLLTALVVACVAFQLNASMLSPVLSTMQEQLHTTADAVGLTQTAFFTAAALFSLFLPRLGDLVGRRRVLGGMLVIMALGCVLAAVAPNVTVLFIARIIQGVSGPTVPLCLIMLRREIPDNKTYGTMMGVLTAINGGVAGVDALAGGYLASNLGFHSVFWTMAIVAAIAGGMVFGMTPESRAEITGRMDWIGVAAIVIAVGTVLTAFNEAGKLAAANWALVVVLIIVGLAAFWAFWELEKRGRHPLVEIRHLRRRSTWALLVTTLLTMTGVFAVMNGLLPALAQDKTVGLGMSAGTSAWWTLTPYAIAGLLMGPWAGRLASTVGYRAILRIGMVGSIIGVAVLAVTTDVTSHALLLILSIFIGATYAGTVNIVLNGLGIVLSPKENPGFLPGMNAGAFNLGAGLSFAVLYAVFTALQPAGGASASSYLVAMLIGAVFMALGLITSLLIPRPVGAEARDEIAAPTP